MPYLKEMTFFARFVPDILAQKKVITIRDASEKDYQAGSVVDVFTLEEGQWFCRLEIVSVEPIRFQSLSDYHAQQENMSLEELKSVIASIYPDEDELYVIRYQLAEA